jgi:hypothetical protein
MTKVMGKAIAIVTEAAMLRSEDRSTLWLACSIQHS